MASISAIGLGSIGLVPARTLLKNGYRVAVWNRTPEMAKPPVAVGATLATPKVSHCRQSGVPAELPQLFSDLAHRASKEGLGDNELAALVEMLS